jgi:hypothetical protein
MWLEQETTCSGLIVSHLYRVRSRLMLRLALVRGSARLYSMDEQTPRYLDYSEYDHDDELEE